MRLPATRFRFRRGGKTPEEPSTDLPPVNQWTAGSALSARVASIGLKVALFCGPAALVVAGFVVATAEPPHPVAAAPFDDLAGDRTAAGEIAQRAVVAWLTTPRGEEVKVAGLLPSYVAPEKPFQIGHPVVADAQSEGDGVWSITVAIGVADEQSVLTDRYFVVPVILAGEPSHRVGSVPALPAVIAGPASTTGPALDYRYRLNPSSPAWQSAAAFLQALAAGHGDITRYTTPGHVVVAIEPPPYTSVTVTDVSSDSEMDPSSHPPDGREQHVLVSAQGATADKQIGLTYALTLQARGGRWEVKAIDPSPRIQQGARRADTAFSPRPSQ